MHAPAACRAIFTENCSTCSSSRGARPWSPQILPAPTCTRRGLFFGPLPAPVEANLRPRFFVDKKWRAGAVAYLYRPRQWRRSPSPLSQGPAPHWMGGNFDVLSSWAMECLVRFIGPVRADVLGRPSGHMASRFAYSARRRKDRSRNYANDDRESCGAR